MPEIVTWVRMDKVHWELGLTPKMLRRGQKTGYLQRNYHFRSGSSGEYWAINRLRMIAGEVRALVFDSGLKHRSSSQFIPANTSRKRELLEELNIRHAKLLELEHLADGICGEVQSLEREYRCILWERSDCPYCGGSGTLGNMVCHYCVEVYQ